METKSPASSRRASLLCGLSHRVLPRSSAHRISTYVLAGDGCIQFLTGLRCKLHRLRLQSLMGKFSLRGRQDGRRKVGRRTRTSDSAQSRLRRYGHVFLRKSCRKLTRSQAYVYLAGQDRSALTWELDCESIAHRSSHLVADIEAVRPAHETW